MTNSKPPGKARKHHFLPECYLQGWADSGGRLVEFAVRHGTVRPRWTAPGGTGYELDLYAMPALGDRSDALEKQLMSMIDSSAASSLIKMRNLELLEPSARDAFATLLTTLMTRTPPSIHALKASLEEWRRKDRPEVQAIYERFVWQPGMPDRAVDQLRASDTQEEGEGFLAETLAAIFTHERVVKFLSTMKWQVLSMPEGAPSLLTGDHPIITSNGLDARDSYLLLPIGPRRLFLATNSQIFADRYVRQTGRVRLAQQANQLIAERARQFVYSSDHDQMGLIAERFGTKPVQAVGEKIAMKDPWGAGRPLGYGPEDAVADYVAWVRRQVDQSASSD